MVRNLNTLPYLRWQYFLSIPDGVYVEYPANRHNCKVISDGPPAFSPKTHPERKLWLVQKSKEDSRIHRIVFLIQLGRRANPEAIKAMKNIGWFSTNLDLLYRNNKSRITFLQSFRFKVLFLIKM